MTLEAWQFKNPALHVKYERETVPCWGCKWVEVVFGRRFCVKGRELRQCKSWEKK